MKLTEKKAIKISIELWEWLAETGKHKHEWQGWEKYGRMSNNCPLCQYRQVKGGEYSIDCSVCPYYQTFGRCYTREGDDTQCATLYEKWDSSESPKTRKKYASLFLAQLKQLEGIC